MRLRASTSRRLAVLLTLAACLGVVQAPASTANDSPAPCTASVPYRSGDAGYWTFRIPAVIQAPGGALLAFAEDHQVSASPVW